MVFNRVDGSLSSPVDWSEQADVDVTEVNWGDILVGVHLHVSEHHLGLLLGHGRKHVVASLIGVVRVGVDGLDLLIGLAEDVQSELVLFHRGEGKTVEGEVLDEFLLNRSNGSVISAHVRTQQGSGNAKVVHI